MRRKHSEPDPVREATRYSFSIPMTIELPAGWFRRDRVDAFLVDLSTGGAALVTGNDQRLSVKKRFRISIDDREGIIEVRNLVQLDEGRLRIGVQFSRLGLELQELVADSIEAARELRSRLDPHPSEA